MGATLFLPLMEQFDFKLNSLKLHRTSRYTAYLFHFAQVQRVLVVRSKLGKTHIRTLRQLCYAANAWEKPFGKKHGHIKRKKNIIEATAISSIYSICFYLNIVCTATIVLQSDRLSSSAEFDNSLLTTTTFSAKVMPARSKSSRQSIDPNIQYTNGK